MIINLSGRVLEIGTTKKTAVKLSNRACFIARDNLSWNIVGSLLRAASDAILGKQSESALPYTLIDRNEDAERVLIDQVEIGMSPHAQKDWAAARLYRDGKQQLICSTSSPLILAGFDRDEIWTVDTQNEPWQLVHPDNEPGLMTSYEIYDEFFSIQRAARKDLNDLEWDLGCLLGIDNRTTEQDQRIKELRKILEPYL